MKGKNLKKRIRHVISLSILLSILFFMAVLSFTAVSSEKSQGYLLASMISNMCSKEIFNQQVLDSLQLDDFKKLKGQYYKTMLFVHRIQAFEDRVLNSYIGPADPGKAIIVPNGLNPDFLPNFHSLRPNDITNGPFAIGEIAQISVTIGDDQVYKSQHWGSSIFQDSFRGKPLYPVIKFLTDYFKVQAVCQVPKSPGVVLPTDGGDPFATVTVRLDPGFLVSYYFFMFMGVVFSAIVAIIVSNIAARILSKSVSQPFSALEGKLRSLALEDYETTLHSQIMVKKRAISEIRSIADSTNTIIGKMQQFNKMQLNQKSQLENLKSELESQKEELLESRQMIQEAQAQLVQSQNLASIGQLTAAISHEINEPLRQIAVSVEKQNHMAEILKTSDLIKNNPENMDLVKQLEEAGNLNGTAFNRVSSIIKSLNNFSRLDLSEMEPTDINENLRSVILLTSNLWKKRINIHGDYGQIPPIMSYPGLINQVFMNIVVNAIHAIPDKGDIFLKTWTDADYVMVSIRDTGTGIAENILPLIFETGFTTKKSGSGSGLGLSISKSIIRKHNGRIDVHSKPGEGAEFIITLPKK